MSKRKRVSRPQHQVLLTHDQKVKWFRDRIVERMNVQPFNGEVDLMSFLRETRKSFKNTYGRDVPGYFIRKLASQLGIPVTVSDSTKKKMEYAFKLMDENENYRNNKTDLVRALESHFGEKTLNYIVDDIWDEWHDRGEHPVATVNVDLHGQESLFE